MSMRGRPVTFEYDRCPKLSTLEGDAIMAALDECDGNKKHAAKVLGIAIRTLRNKINKYKLHHLKGDIRSMILAVREDRRSEVR